ncbi:MAG: ATP-binding protein, partial [Hyphomonas sp.]|nr:ATP-binding protein [Hyphomonas sp.]
MTTEQAGIAASYNEFVRRPTGLIHRLFAKPPYPTYRLDVGARIEAGSSWQFAVVLAHAYAAQGNIIGKQDAGATLVWATGTVSPVNLRIGPVGHVREKLLRSLDLFAAARERGRPVRLFVAEDNLGDIDPVLGDQLAALQIHVTAISHLDEALDQLGLPGTSRAADAMAEPVRGWTGNPYRGLKPFLAEHRAVFFGRARAREEALELLRGAAAQTGKAFLLVHGRSGVGKSSFVRAGLAGDVEERAAEAGRIVRVTLTPEGPEGPAAALVSELASVLGAIDRDAGPAELAARISAWSRTTPEPRTLLVLIDQLEVLFDPEVSGESRTAFASLVDALVMRGRAWVIATLRAESVGQLDTVPALARLAGPGRVYRLDRPSRAELAEIIAAPAALAGRNFAEPA